MNTFTKSLIASGLLAAVSAMDNGERQHTARRRNPLALLRQRFITRRGRRVGPKKLGNVAQANGGHVAQADEVYAVKRIPSFEVGVNVLVMSKNQNGTITALLDSDSRPIATTSGQSDQDIQFKHRVKKYLIKLDGSQAELPYAKHDFTTLSKCGTEDALMVSCWEAAECVEVIRLIKEPDGSIPEAVKKYSNLVQNHPTAIPRIESAVRENHVENRYYLVLAAHQEIARNEAALLALERKDLIAAIAQACPDSKINVTGFDTVPTIVETIDPTDYAKVLLAEHDRVWKSSPIPGLFSTFEPLITGQQNIGGQEMYTVSITQYKLGRRQDLVIFKSYHQFFKLYDALLTRHGERYLSSVRVAPQGNIERFLSLLSSTRKASLETTIERQTPLKQLQEFLNVVVKHFSTDPAVTDFMKQ